MFENLTIEQYNELLASKAPTPGGGSALAMVGTVACSLVEMAINVTLEKLDRDCDEHHYLTSEREVAARAKKALYKLSSDDATAFQHIIDCLRLPKSTADEQKHRKGELQKAYHKSAIVPLDVMSICAEMTKRSKLRILPQLNKYVSSDCVIAIDLFKTIGRNSLVNVHANTDFLTDEALKSRLEKQASELLAEIEK